MRAGQIYLIVALGLLGISYIKERQKTKEALKATLKIFYTIIPVLVFVFVLMGLIQAYVSSKTIASILARKAVSSESSMPKLSEALPCLCRLLSFPLGGTSLRMGQAMARLRDLSLQRS